MISIYWLIGIIPASAAFGFFACAILTVAKRSDEEWERTKK